MRRARGDQTRGYCHDVHRFRARSALPGDPQAPSKLKRVYKIDISGERPDDATQRAQRREW
jgi:hypothetical protein